MRCDIETNEDKGVSPPPPKNDKAEVTCNSGGHFEQS